MSEASKVIKDWFDRVGEDYTCDNVGALFNHEFLPKFSNIVPENSSEYPDYKTRKTDPDYELKGEAYLKESRDLLKQRWSLLSDSGYQFVECSRYNEHCKGIIKIGECYFIAEWDEQSYADTDYDQIKDTITEVTPYQETVTKYKTL